MLVNFTVKNFRSFQQEKTFSMEASSIEEHKESVITKSDYSLLPLSVFYGANSSGKSNFIKALAVMRHMVKNSVRLNDNEALPYEPFLLDSISQQHPTSFEIQFIKNNALYRYGFEYNKHDIISEWLYENRFGKEEYELFVRSGDSIEVSSKEFPEGKGKEDLTNPNRLFLSLVAQLKGEKSNSIISWFGECNVLSGIDTEWYELFTLKMFLEHLNGVDEAQEFFQTLQLGFSEFSVEKIEDFKEELVHFPEIIKERVQKDLAAGKKFVDPQTTHTIFSENGQVLGQRRFNKDQMESEGTKKIIELSGPIFDTLNKGGILIVDELDAKLHPLLTRNIILLFMNPDKNKNGAQLIFATHDTNQLDLDIIRRDQIWFAEKDKVESTDIYSLVEFKEESNRSIHKESDIKRDYIRGRYGAIPFIGK